VTTPVQRLLKLVGESPFWRTMGHVHTRLYRLTGGRVGHAAGPLTNLLLTTTGRRSGEARTVPLAYVADGGYWVVVASNGGADRHPAWWLNLRRSPMATIEVGTARFDVTAREATEAERGRLWPELKRLNPFFAQYERITERRIPVVMLEPVRPAS
jgi:deazaflavin-dependent oxidoreductase (nitroreductase family)